MNKMIRAFMALASFALCSALFGTSVDLYVGSGQTLNFNIGGTADANFTVIDLSTNQTVATVSALTTHIGYGTSYNYYGYPSGSGISFTNNYPDSGILSGLPAGDYRVEVSSPGLSEFGSPYSWGSGAEIVLYDAYNWMDIYLNVY